MSNYIKKYNVGNIRIDLPYNSYIHELPLLSFKDFRNSVNISLIFNHKLRIDNVNSFNIKEGYKLNIQKKIIKNSNGKPIKIIDANGKYVNLLSNANYENGSSVENNLYTFDDESKRVLRVLSSGYEIEYEDLSKEVYNELGYITSTIDKYQDLILTYTYTNNLLTKVSYKGKEVSFTYNNNTLQTISYGGTTSQLTITESNLSVNHYSNVTYIMTLSNTMYKVEANGYENNELFSVSKECVYEGNNIILNSKVGQDVVDTITYNFSSLVTNGYNLFDVINITNKTGVSKRVHYLNETILYSYEIKDDNDVEFDNELCISDVNIYNTYNFASNYSFNGIIKYDDGVKLSKESPSSNKYIYDASFYDINYTKGCYLVTGWVKISDSNSIVKLEVENENELGYEFDIPTKEANKWHFFACQCELYNANVVKIFSSTIGAELKDVRVTYQIHSIIEPNKESHSIYKEDVLILEENEIKALKDVIFNVPTDANITLSDVLRYLRRKVNNKTGEIYYNNGKNVISNINTLEFKLNEGENFKAIDNYSVGYRYYNNGVETYCKTERINEGNKILKISTYENQMDESLENLKSINYLNIYFDLVEKRDYFNVKLNVANNDNEIEIGEVISKFYRDKGLVTKETDSKTYSYEYSYNEPLNKMVFKDELLDGTLRYSISYYIDSIWGVVYKEEQSGNTDTQITYDSDKSTILQEEFNESNSSAIHKYSYDKGKLTSLSCGNLKYNFEYNKNDLSKVLKFNSQIEEHSHTDFTSTMYYPSFSSPIYSKQYNYDKYQRLTSIEGELVNTYGFGFDKDTGEPLNISSNASSKLIMVEDKLVGEKTRFAYDEKGMVIFKLTSRSTGVSQVISQESFEYDKAKRLKTKQFMCDLSNITVAQEDITYTSQENDTNIDSRVKSINYKINDQNVVNTTYGYVNEEISGDRGDRRLNKKTYTFNDDCKYSKAYGIEYDKINNETLTFNQTLKNTVSYTYDFLNRISSITKDNKTTTYEYDGFGRLVRENNEALDKTIVYTYNEYGNIVSYSTYGFNNLSNLRYTKSYTYDGIEKDRVVNFNNTTITYNSLGCPTTHKGYNVTWSKGKLTGLSKGTLKTGTTMYNYSYNAFGQRISKDYTYIPATLGSIAIGIMTDYSKKYYYDDYGRLIKETSLSTYYNNGTINEEIKYLYDVNNIIGFKYTKNSTTNTYYFERNILGDVVAIYDTLGNLKVKYLYDAYGNCTVSSETTDSALASANPIRYRGYYYDVETQLFYCNSRYYSPELCRWISPDDIEYLDPESVNGLNLYAYCGNDPVNRYDPSGHFWDVVFDIGSILWSAYDLYKNPTWENVGWLALDVVFAVVPFLTGSGGLKAVSKMDDLYDLSKITSSADEIYMLGQSMGKRVIPEAINLGVDWYHGFDYYNDMAKVSKSMANLYGYIDNMAFIANKAFDGVKFIDMGFDATRTLKGARKGGKLGVELLSRFTIYSERFVAIAFRKKNLARMMRRFYKWLF